MLNAAVRLHQIAPSGIVIAVRHRTCRSAKYTRCKGVRRFGLDIAHIIVRPNVGFVERTVVFASELPQTIVRVTILNHARSIGDLRDVAVGVVGGNTEKIFPLCVPFFAQSHLGFIFARFFVMWGQVFTLTVSCIHAKTLICKLMIILQSRINNPKAFIIEFNTATYGKHITICIRFHMVLHSKQRRFIFAIILFSIGLYEILF